MKEKKIRDALHGEAKTAKTAGPGKQPGGSESDGSGFGGSGKSGGGDSAELQAKIDAYFEGCRGKPLLDETGRAEKTPKGDPVYLIPPKPPSVSGLALALRFPTRQALMEYEGGDDGGVILRARLRVEEYLEEKLLDKDCLNGAKFILINSFKGWREKPEAAADTGITIDLGEAAIFSE